MNAGKIPAGLERARFALKHAGPLTPAEVAEFEAQKARVRHQDEARRQPSPQLELPEAA